MNQLSAPVDELSRALCHAMFIALPGHQPLNPEIRAQVSANLKTENARNYAMQAVSSGSIRGYVVRAFFPQLWGSTALGFGGIGGASMTTAYTIVIEGPEGSQAVYWHGLHAYNIDPEKQTAEQRDAYAQDLARQALMHVRGAIETYGAIPNERYRADGW